MAKNKSAAVFTASMASAVLLSAAAVAGDEKGEWRTYSQEPNGDVHYFDASRVKVANNLQRVWSRIRYKTSVMGAASYQSLLEIDCSKQTEQILQNTFFSDKHWKKPAMMADKTAKPKRQIAKGSAVERLSRILCDQ